MRHAVLAFAVAMRMKVPTGDLITNEMIEEINRMDPAKIAAEAAAYRYSR
jgi:hypothetical protein